jgi:hypothetical protein
MGVISAIVKKIIDASSLEARATSVEYAAYLHR